MHEEMTITLGSWKANNPAPHAVFMARSSPDSLLIVYQNGAVDLFEYHPFDTKLYCTVRCEEGTLVGLRDAIHIPNSKRLVYIARSGTGFYLMDLPSTGPHQFTETAGRLSRMFCSVELRAASVRIVFVNQPDDESDHDRRKISIYSLKNQETSHIFEVLAATPFLDMSSKGLLFYRPPVPENRICILNVHSNEELVPIEVDDFEFRHISTNPGGTHIVIGILRSFRIYEVASGTVLFSHTNQGYADINSSWWYHLIDATVLILPCPTLQFSRILSLNEDCRSELSWGALKFRNKCNLSLRRVNGLPYIQYIDVYNQLKLVRFNESEKQWDEI